MAINGKKWTLVSAWQFMAISGNYGALSVANSGK